MTVEQEVQPVVSNEVPAVQEEAAVSPEGQASENGGSGDAASVTPEVPTADELATVRAELEALKAQHASELAQKQSALETAVSNGTALQAVINELVFSRGAVVTSDDQGPSNRNTSAATSATQPPKILSLAELGQLRKTS